MHEGKKKDENPPLYRLYVHRMRLRVCVRVYFAEQSFAACVHIVQYERAYHAMRTLCIPSPRDATLTQLQHWYACLPFFCTFTRTLTHSHAHDIHSKLSGHISCMIRTLFTHCTVKCFSCLLENVYRLDIMIRNHWNMCDSCCFNHINMKFLPKLTTCRIFPDWSINQTKWSIADTVIWCTIQLTHLFLCHKKYLVY